MQRQQNENSQKMKTRKKENYSTYLNPLTHTHIHTHFGKKVEAYDTDE